jgi:hypothetical protein
MAKPIALAKDIAFAFPNVCTTTIPGVGPVPIPYPSIAQLVDATPVSDTGKELLVKGTKVLLEDSEVAQTSGDEPADPGTKSGSCTMTQFSGSVFYGGKGLVRFGDQTEQNGKNAMGTVLSAEPSVLVGD